VSESLLDTIEPKSDQLNYDDLLGGPVTVRVTGVKRGSKEQPVIVELDDNVRPFKPCKSMRRVLIAAWGERGADWIGRSMTLYGDSTVKYGGVEVGGIRISHLSHIDKALHIALTVTRGKRAPFIVYPLTAEPSRADKCRAWLRQAGIAVKDAEAMIGKPLDEATAEDFARIGKMKGPQS